MCQCKEMELGVCSRVWKKLGKTENTCFKNDVGEVCDNKRKQLLMVINGEQGFIDLPSD